MNEYTLRAAFADAKAENYQPSVDVDADVIASLCSDLIDAVSDQIDPSLFESDEAFRVHVMGEAFVRTFEAGYRVALDAREEDIEVTIQLDKETITGLVQRALTGEQPLKE